MSHLCLRELKSTFSREGERIKSAADPTLEYPNHIHRFPDAKHFASYTGLVPSTYASSSRLTHGPLTKQGNRWLRWAFIEPVYRAIAEHQPHPPPAVIIPPRVTAMPSSTTDTTPSPRDRHIQMVQEKGRLGWQKAVGYGKRALVETAMFR